MKMFRLNNAADNEQFWFTAETTDEAVALASKQLSAKCTLLHECDPTTYPGNITIEGIAVLRIPTLSFADLIAGDAGLSGRLWVIRSETATQEIPW